MPKNVRHRLCIATVGLTQVVYLLARRRSCIVGQLSRRQLPTNASRELWEFAYATEIVRKIVLGDPRLVPKVLHPSWGSLEGLFKFPVTSWFPFEIPCVSFGRLLCPLGCPGDPFGVLVVLGVPWGRLHVGPFILFFLVSAPPSQMQQLFVKETHRLSTTKLHHTGVTLGDIASKV